MINADQYSEQKKKEKRTMGESNEFSKDVRRRIAALHKLWRCLGAISKILDIQRSSVQTNV